MDHHELNDGGAVDRHVGAAIRARREALGLGRDALAEALSVTPLEIARFESGRSRVSASALFTIASRLGSPVSVFYAGLRGSVGAGLPREPTPAVEVLRLMTALPLERQSVVLDTVRGMARAGAD